MSDGAGAPVPETDAIETRESPYGFDETMGRLLSTIEGRGLRLFAVIDHDGAAREARFELRPTGVVLICSRAADTPLMTEAALVALQLPLRILVWERDDGLTMVGYLTTEALLAPAGVDPSRAPALSGVPGLIDAAITPG